MKLYTRLIEEGIFIFWNSDEGNTSYNLKIRIAVGDDKVELVHLAMPKGQNYYSFDKIGSGDYEIELNGYRDNLIYQTETKKAKIVSSVQRLQEQMEKLDSCIEHINYVYQREGLLIDISDDITNIVNALTDPKTILRIREKVDDEEKWGWSR